MEHLKVLGKELLFFLDVSSQSNCSGNSLFQCLPCPAKVSHSSNDRSVCICTSAPGGKPLTINEFLYFNTTNGICEVLNIELIPQIIKGVQFSFNTSVNRYIIYLFIRMLFL